MVVYFIEDIMKNQCQNHFAFHGVKNYRNGGTVLLLCGLLDGGIFIGTNFGDYSN
jgi:hypothetical protein